MPGGNFGSDRWPIMSLGVGLQAGKKHKKQVAFIWPQVLYFAVVELRPLRVTKRAFSWPPFGFVCCHEL